MKKLFFLGLSLLSAMLIFTGCGSTKFTDAKLSVPDITVISPSIVDGKLLTATAASREPNSPRGENQSPALSWDAVEDANYYAVIMFDEDANWLHFLVTDITATELSQGAYTDEKTYIGPYPPKSEGAHIYRIEVFATREQPNYPIEQLADSGLKVPVVKLMGLPAKRRLYHNPYITAADIAKDRMKIN